MRISSSFDLLYVYMSRSRKMKIGFLGCGAIGSIYAGYLSNKHDVYIVDTSQKVVDAVRAHGILIDECVPGAGNGETISCRPALITTDPAEVGTVDLLIVFVRYMYLEAACRNALPMIGKDTIVMTLQNGIGNYDEIAKVVPEDQIVIGNTSHGSTGIAPGHVRHMGIGVTYIGSLKAPIAKAYKAAEALTAAGFETVVREDDVMAVIWHKAFANVAINAITALLGETNSLISSNEYARKAAGLLVNEAIDVAIAGGCQIDREAELKHAFDVAESTAANKSSMLQDVEGKRQTEIMIINGAVSKIGREHNIPTPYNDMIVQLILAKESLYLGER